MAPEEDFVTRLGERDLALIAAAGGGLTVHAKIGVEALVKIATAGLAKNSGLVVYHSIRLTVDDMIRIATVAPGRVEFR